MRVTFPNPLGPPITLDTSQLSPLPLPVRLASLHRRGQVRIIVVIIVLLAILGVRPSPPFPIGYGAEWKSERNLPWLSRGATFPEGREGRYLK